MCCDTALPQKGRMSSVGDSISCHTIDKKRALELIELLEVKLREQEPLAKET